jgi:hypothetical protein
MASRFQAFVIEAIIARRCLRLDMMDETTPPQSSQKESTTHRCESHQPTALDFQVPSSSLVLCPAFDSFDQVSLVFLQSSVPIDYMHQIPWLAQCQFDPVQEDPCRIADYSILNFDIHGRNSWLLQGQISSSNGAHNPYGDEIIPFSPISDLVCVLPMWLKEIGEKEENGAVPSSSLVAQVEQSEDFWSEVENLVQENNYVLAMYATV